MADTKNYGLKGVGDDVQFGKAGGRFVFNTGASDFRATDSGGSTLVHLQVLTPVGDTDAATKLYVDDTAAGLDFKESVTCATTADMGATYAAGGGAAGNGQFTSVPATIDGVTLATGDRVLVKNESAATENGIYVVTATTTIIDRATDHDSDAEVSAGNFTFVEEGTVNADTGWVLQGPDPLTINTSALDWVLFSTSGTLIAGIGLVKNGNVLDLDFSELTSATTITTADELIFQDGGVESRITVANFLADRDIVTATANGVLVRTANDTYASRTLTAGGAGNTDGITISNGDGVSGNPTIGLDITGTAANAEAVVTGDTLLMFNVSTVANEEVTVDTLKTFFNAGTSSTSITEGDTTVAVADAGAGTVTTTVDGAITILSTVSLNTFTIDSATTNADIPVIRLSATSTGTPLVGIGPSIEFEAETSAGAPGNQEVGGVFALEATDVTALSEDFDFVFSTMAGGGAAATRMRISSLGVITATTFSGDLTIDGTAFVTVDTAGQFTDDDVTIMTAAAVNDRIESFGYSTTTGTVTSSGTPLNNEVAVFATGTDINSDSTFTWDTTTLIVNELSFAGDTISNNTTNQPLILRPNGTGSIILQNGSGEEILELLDVTAAINGLAITPGTTGNKPIISIGSGGEANIDIGFATNGTGVLSVAAGTYEANVTDDDDIPNKKYVDDAIEAVGGSGTLDSVRGTVNIATLGDQNIGAAGGIPANAIIVSVIVEVTDISDTASTVTVGNAVDGDAVYMATTENDPEILGLYKADLRVVNGGVARQATATVISDSTASASAEVIITFIHA